LIREVDEDNRRQNKIKLTEKGEKNFKKIKEISLNYESKVLENLDDKQIRELKKLLKSIAIETNKIKENRSK